MRKGKTYILVTALLVAVIALAGVLAACGGDDTTEQRQRQRISAPAAIEGSAMERATAILGHAPTGLAPTSSPRARSSWPTTPTTHRRARSIPTTKEVVGFDVDVAKGMAEILGLGIKWEHPAWETIPGGLNNGRYDVSIGSMTSPSTA